MRFQYTNHRGETKERNVKPLTLTYFDNPAAVSHHLLGYPPGYFLEALDLDRNEKRHFYLGFDTMRRLKNIVPGDGWPLEIGDLKQIEGAVDGLAQRAVEHVGKKVVSAEISSIANKWLAKTPEGFYGTPDTLAEVKKLAAFALGQDETPSNDGDNGRDGLDV